MVREGLGLISLLVVPRKYGAMWHVVPKGAIYGDGVAKILRGKGLHGEA
jgi:hypothetical protein